MVRMSQWKAKCCHGDRAAKKISLYCYQGDGCGQEGKVGEGKNGRKEEGEDDMRDRRRDDKLSLEAQRYEPGLYYSLHLCLVYAG